MNKLLTIVISSVFALTLFANPGPRPNGPRPVGHHPGPRPAPHHPAPPPHHYHHNDWIGPTILGSALLGSAIINATTPAPQPTVVVQQPVVVQPVWIPAHYENQVQPNGVIVRVFVPGHWQ